MIEIKGQYTLNDYQQAQRLNARAGKGRNLLIAVLYLIAACQLAFMLAFFIPSREWSAVVGLALLGVLYLLFFYGYVPLRVKRIFYQQKELQLPFCLEIDENGLDVRNELGHSHRPWKGYTSWREDEHLLLLYLAEGSFQMLPKRLAGVGVVDFVRQRLRAYKIPQK